MNHFYQQFTIIDFLEMFLPGAVTMLILNWCGIPLTGFWYAFFPEGMIGISFYFVVMSYIVGHLLCQITKIIENIPAFQNSWKSVERRYMAAVEKKALAAGLLEYLPDIETTLQYQEQVLRRVYYFVLANTDCRRLRLMNGFYGLCRTSIGATAISAISIAVKVHDKPIFCIASVLAGVGIIILLWHRAKKFGKIATETTYESFLIYHAQK